MQWLSLVFFFIFTNLNAEIVKFTSASPFSFFDIVTSLDSHNEEIVFGELKFPDNKENKKYPLVIGVAGSLGWKEHHHDQLRIFREMGMATFELQSFKSRGVISTVGTQTQVTTATMILDSYRALDVLSLHPLIDNRNIAITGWSLGGTVALFSGWNTLIETIKPMNKFSAHLSYYPLCIAIPENLDFTKSPIHILIGEEDNWTPSNACEEFVFELNELDYNAGITVLKDSHHSFDSKLELTKIEDGYSFVDCSFKIRDDGAVIMKPFRIPMNSPFLQKIGLSMCTERGTIVEGNSEARIFAHNFSKLFMKKYLLESY